jgi:hypothetical protein
VSRRSSSSGGPAFAAFVLLGVAALVVRGDPVTASRRSQRAAFAASEIGPAPPRTMSPLLLAALGSGAVGAIVMLLFEGPLARVVGIGALAAFIVCSVFVIASPSMLGRVDIEELES